jgi:hypothetical protein
VPVWGIGTVRSVGEGLGESVGYGERFYGYMPMSKYVVLTPDDGSLVPRIGFADGTAGRSSLFGADTGFYNYYYNLLTDPYLAISEEDELEDLATNEEFMCVLRVLFETGYGLCDFFTEVGFHGADRIVLSSASSKTAFATAFCVRRLQPQMEVVGLTSGPPDGDGLRFCSGLGSIGSGGMFESMFTELICYDQLEDQLDADTSTLYIDIAGNPTLTRRVHTHLGESLLHSCAVGRTHVTTDTDTDTEEEEAAEQGASTEPLPGPKPAFYFVPTWKRNKAAEVGGQFKLQLSLAELYLPFLAACRHRIDLHMGYGLEAVGACYNELTIHGNSKPDVAHVLSLWERGEPRYGSAAAAASRL